LKTAGGLEFLQLNMHHCKSAALNLRQTFDVGCTDIAMIQEPYSYKNHIKGLNSKVGSILVGTRTGKPRACMFVSNDIQASILQEFSDPDQVTVRITYKRNETEQTLICCSVYCPFDSINPPPSEMLRATVAFAETNNIPIIIGCDANSHHVAWGSTDTNSRGTALLEYVASSKLEILNRGNEPTFVTRSRSEVIDISLSSSAIWQDIVDWRVTREISVSDHRIIRFKMLADPTIPRQYRNPLSTDWTRYKDELAWGLNGWNCNIETTNDIEINVSLMQKAIIAAYEASCPLRTVKPGRNTPYWSSDLAKLRKAARKAWNHRNRDPEGYKIATREYSKSLRKAERVSFKKFSSEVDGVKPTARLQKILSKDNSYQIGNFRLPSGEFTRSDQEVAAHLLETHFPGCEPISENFVSTPDAVVPPSEEDWLEASRIISEDKIRWSIAGFGPFKTAGEDGIFPALLKHGIEILIVPLQRIFTACLALGYIPKPWRKVKVIFIPKPGRDSYEMAKAFRPISLTSFFLKTMERIIDQYIRTGPLKRSPLHESQHAYQRSKSCETALHDLVSRIEVALNHKIFAFGTFLDVEGAFDNASFDSMITASYDHTVDNMTTKWIDSMLKYRAVRAEIRGVSSTMKVRRGCPQGGVLSPLLWNMVIDSLLRRLEEQGLWAQGFADDVVILINGKYLGTVCELMQSALLIVQEWCEQVGLSVNPNKTTAILFTNKRNLNGYKTPIIFGKELELQNQVKYLGVILDSKLNWNCHIDHRLRKATIALWQCRRAIGKTWGLKPKVVYWIYTSIVRPILTFAAILWWKKTTQQTVNRKIGSLQRLACLCVTGSMRSTPTSALEALLSLPPLSIFIEKESRQAAYRLKCIGKINRTSIGHSVILSRMTEENPVLLAPCDKIEPTNVFGRRFSVEFPSRSDWADQKSILPTESEAFFTDGSLVNGQAGAGVYSESQDTGESYALGTLVTVFQSEVYAILMCSEKCRDLRLQNKIICICSDSRASLLALSSYTISSSIVSQCWLSLQELSSDNRVRLYWVPGHCDINGNEKADELARQGSGSNFCGPEPCLPLSTSITRQKTKEWANNTHSRLWNENSGCRQSKQWIAQPQLKVTKYLLNLSRNRLRILVSLITGHCCLNSHLHKMELTSSPICGACSIEAESAFHFLCVCPTLAILRTRVMGKPIINALEFKEIPASDILRFASLSGRFGSDP
jgi:ribonuclease HI